MVDASKVIEELQAIVGIEFVQAMTSLDAYHVDGRGPWAVVIPGDINQVAAALALAHRLRRLEAIRDVAARMMDRPQLNRDIFPRGFPEPIAEIKQPEWSATLYDLLSAYATQRSRRALSRVRFKQRTVWSLAEARTALERLMGQSTDWSRIDQFLISYVVEPAFAATVFASSFASALELVREGRAEIHQKESFAPINMRKRVGANGNATTHDAQEKA